MKNPTKIFSLLFALSCAVALLSSGSAFAETENQEQTIACPCGYLCDIQWTYCIVCGLDLSRTSSARSSEGNIDKKILDHVNHAVLGIEAYYKELSIFNVISRREAKWLKTLKNVKEPDETFYRRYRSGWLYDNNGHIVTAADLLENVDSLKVRFWFNEERDAKVVGYDLATGVGVIKIEGELPKPLKLGDPAGSKLGDSIWIVGFPVAYFAKKAVQRLPEKVAKGTLTGKNKTNMNALQIENYLQTDVSPNLGMYGGVFINASGEVLGMMTESIDEGISVASSIDIVHETVQRIIRGEKVSRGYIGAGISRVSPFLKEKFKLEEDEGMVVEYTVPESPAEKAGVKKGDLILKVDDKKVDSTFLCQKEVFAKEAGAAVSLDIKRGKEVLKLSVTPQERPAEIFLHPLDEIEQYYGFYLTEESEGYVSQQGLKIAGMLPGALAEVRDFEIGDLIFKITDFYMVSTFKDFNDVIRKIMKEFNETRYDKSKPSPYKTFSVSLKIRKKNGEKKFFDYDSQYSNYYCPTVM